MVVEIDSMSDQNLSNIYLETFKENKGIVFIDKEYVF